MRAVIVDQPGGVEAMRVGERPDPVAGEGEVLVRVAAAGVNRADLLQRQGNYDPPPGTTDVMGLECSGTVEALGAGVDDLAVGDEVVALLSGGGYAELVAVPRGQVAPVPEGLDLVDAGGLMETAATVWANVFLTAGLREGERLLVHGGASGIGTTAIQLAVARGASVVVTVGSEEKAAVCRELGAERTINYKEQDFAAELKGEVDVVLDSIGAKYLAGNVKVLRRGGRIAVIGMQGGVKGELNLGALLAKNATIGAASLRMRPVEEKTAIVQDLVEHVWPLVTTGSVRPVVHARLPLDDVRQAHTVLEESSHVGKVLLTP
ncbi:MAG: NAD(P)H-quinone oxidoreductase [Aeromicrobium erythreum]